MFNKDAFLQGESRVLHTKPVLNAVKMAWKIVGK